MLPLLDDSLPKKMLGLLFFSLFLLQIYAQPTTRLDSLLQNIDQQKGEAYYDQMFEIGKLQGNPEEKIATYQKILAKAQQEKEEKILIDVHRKLGITFGSKANLNQALHHYDQAIQYANRIGDIDEELKTMSNKSYQLSLAGRMDEAFEILITALRKAEKEGTMPKVEAELHLGLGDHYRLLHDVAQATFYIEKALAYFETQKSYTKRCQVIYTLANTYKIGKTDEQKRKGKAYFEQLLGPPYFEHLPPFIIPKIETSLGGILVSLGDFEEAEKLLLKSLATKEANKDTASMVYTYTELITLYTEVKEAEKAVFYGEKILAITQNSDDLFSLANSYDMLAGAYADVGDFKNAFLYMNKRNIINDSLMNEEKLTALAEMETKYQTDLQQEQLARQKAELQQQRSQTTLLIGGLVLLSLLIFWWLQSRLRFKVKETAQLEALNQTKTRFFTNIAHELRTPLTLVINPLRQLERKPDTNFVPLPHQQLDRIVRNGERLERLIKQMTDLSKLEEGKYLLRAKKQNLVSFLNEIVKAFDPIAREQQKQLSFSSQAHELMLYFDAQKMEDIILNLLYNAFKFTNANDRISIQLSQVESHLQVLVEDTGEGMDSRQLTRIFDRFYQINDRDDRQSEGMGIGLALVKEMIELHHGDIRVHSQLGQGSSFYLTFPLGKEHLSKQEMVTELNWQAQSIQWMETTPLSIEDDAPQEVTKPLILVVEDNTDLSHYLSEELRPYYELIQAKDGKEGLEKAILHIPELIISDVMMPQMDGFEFCENIKKDERTSHIPVLLLTAKTGVENMRKGITLGADDYITKPFDPKIFFTKINNQIIQRRKLQALFSKKVSLQHSEIKVVSRDDQFLVDVLAIVEKNIANYNFGVEELSKELNFSRSQLYRKLKALTNQSPNVFLRTIRLERALALLEQSAGNASEIAYQVGFNNPNYFFKCFKDHFGMTPKEALAQKVKEASEK